jgi:hypothetical protein
MERQKDMKVAKGRDASAPLRRPETPASHLTPPSVSPSATPIPATARGRDYMSHEDLNEDYEDQEHGDHMAPRVPSFYQTEYQRAFSAPWFHPSPTPSHHQQDVLNGSHLTTEYRWEYTDHNHPQYDPEATLTSQESHDLDKHICSNDVTSIVSYLSTNDSARRNPKVTNLLK